MPILVTPAISPDMAAGSKETVDLDGPMDAFYYHDTFNCHVIERGNFLTLLDF